MEAPPEQEIRGEDTAPAWDAVPAESDGSLESPLPHQIRDNDDPAPAPAAGVVAAGGVLGALQKLMDHATGTRGGGLGASLQQLFEIVVDRRLQASCFFLIWGCCMLIYGLVLNPSANPEHIFVGFVLFTIGTGLALLTLAGAGPARAAAHAERFLMGFF